MSVSLVMQPRTLFVSFAARAHYPLMSSSQVLCCRDAPQGVSQWPVLLFVCSQMQDWHFSFLSFRRFLLDHSSICLSFTAWQLCPKFTDWSAQSGVICKPSDHTLPSGRALVKMLNRSGQGQPNALNISLQAAWSTSFTAWLINPLFYPSYEYFPCSAFYY